MESTHQTRDTCVGLLRDHVLSPLGRAQRAIQREDKEVAAGIRAFAAFKDWVAGIESVSTSQGGSRATARTFAVEKGEQEHERIRSAFRETVLSVDHYEETYGETLNEHAAAELSTDVATVLDRDRTGPFTELYRKTLINAASAAVDKRERFRDMLDAERDAVEEAEAELRDILDGNDSAAIDWRQDDIEHRLEAVAES